MVSCWRGVLAASLLAPLAAQADFEVYELSGSMTFYGSPVNVGDIVPLGMLTSSGSLGPASAKLRPTTYDVLWPQNPYGTRGVARFAAVGDAGANYMLPSDRWGNTSAASVGEVRDFTTWNHYFGVDYGGGHEFGMSVDSSGDEASIEFEFNEVAYSLQSAQASSDIYTTLDNSIFDLNPAIGAIRIDKTAMLPTSWDAVTAAYDVTRGLVDVFGSSVASPFYDGLWTSAYVDFRMGGSVVDARFSNYSPLLGMWSAGEGETSRFADRQTVTFFNNLGALDLGVYEMTLYDIVWQTYGSDTGLFDATYPANGYFRGSRTYSLEVVPEPATLLALGAGLAALAARRKKS